MRNTHINAGCVFDTLAFLSSYLEEASGGVPPEIPCIQRVRDRLMDKKVNIPHCLYPFFARVRGKPAFIDLLLFNNVPYSKCTKDAVFLSLKNTAFVFRKYIEHYLPGSSTRTVQRRIAEHPDGLYMIKQLQLEQSLEMYVYYSILRFDEILPALCSAFERVYTEVEAEHSLFVSTIMDIAHENKLRALSGAGENESIQYSFTLTEPRLISFRPAEPAFFLLGSDYESVLETEYKYINVTPYSFAQAIGNPAKYAIYQALLKKSPLTRAEMEITLHLSRAALDHNLKDMRQSGLVVMSKRRRDTYYYELDPEIVRIAAEKMLSEIHAQILR